MRAGIGVCAGLAVLEAPPGTKLPPLELLCTLDEETGLTGECVCVVVRGDVRPLDACCLCSQPAALLGCPRPPA